MCVFFAIYDETSYSFLGRKMRKALKDVCMNKGSDIPGYFSNEKLIS